MNRISEEREILHRTELRHHKALLLENIKAHEEERKRIAVLIHDDIASKLNILSLWLANAAIKDERAAEIIARQIAVLLEDTRNISHFLYPVNLEIVGFQLYLEELIAHLAQKVTVEVKIYTEEKQKDPFIDIQLYRIIQEFTTNVLKHSTATEVHIFIKNSKEGRAMVISENGQGFDCDHIKKGMGMKNIESRIEVMNGHFKWKSRRNRGTRLIIKT